MTTCVAGSGTKLPELALYGDPIHRVDRAGDP